MRVKVAVLTPITWPYESTNGPPELPVQIPSNQSMKNQDKHNFFLSLTMAEIIIKNNIRSCEGSWNENEKLLYY